MGTALRNQGLDVLKGALLLLVIAGHLIQYAHLSAYLFRVIYAFHMPAFLAIAGYLFNAQRWADDLVGFCRRYSERLLLPWLLGTLVYSFAHRPNASWASYLVSCVATPWFHLWFLPAVLLMMVITLALVRAGASATWIFLVSAALAFACSLAIGPYPLASPDQRYFLFFPFFALGLALRQHTFSIPPWLNWPLLAVCFLMFLTGKLGLIGKLPNLWKDLLPACAFSVAGIAIAKSLAPVGVPARILAFRGRESLPIYLWHVLPIHILSRQLGVGWPMVISAIVLIVLELAVIWQMSRRRLPASISVLVFGRRAFAPV